MEQGVRILVVDDEEPFRKLLERNLARGGAVVAGVSTGDQALQAIHDQEFDVAILDVAMPGMSGVELLSRLKHEHGGSPIEAIMLTGHATLDSAIEAMKLGAYDYLEKPVKMTELQLVIGKAYEKRRLKAENRTLRDELERREPPSEIVGASEAMRQVAALIERVAPTSSSVLILGESGTGKELVARALHKRSLRAERPFIAINCGALQETLLENELFGHVRGAFTGATVERRGLFEMADHGTLFIDEVCEMAPGIQKKFLRVLEGGEFRRLGEGRVRKVDVRIVAATNKDVEREVGEGRFREDLYYRLNVVAIELPPLRVRKGDIPLLVRNFLERARTELGRQAAAVTAIEPAALEKLERHDWPGNVRELFNILERALIVTGSERIRAEDIPDLAARRSPVLPLPPGERVGVRGPEPPAPAPAPAPLAPAHVREEPSAPAPPPSLLHGAAAAAAPQDGNGGGSREPAHTLNELERQHILAILEACAGNKTKAALELGISLRSLYRKLEKYAIL